MSHALSALLGFLAAAFLAVASAWLQRRNWVYQTRISQEERDRKAALEAVAELSELAGRRIFRQKRFLWALRSGEGVGIAAKEYRQALVDWNDKLGGLEARLSSSFGYELRHDLELNIHRPLARAHKILDDVHKARTPRSTLGIVERELNRVTGRVTSTVGTLLRRVHSLNLRGYDGAGTISVHNRKNLSCSFLLARLFGLAEDS